jgi:transketolase
MFNEFQNNQWCRMGPRAMFGQFMMEMVKKNKNLIVLSADLGRSSGLDRFKKEFPNNYLSVGICEQNMIGVAAGLVREGYKVFVTSFAPFLTMRASEQVRMNLGYMKHNVHLVALGSGVTMGYLGNSHYGLEDISIIRSIPGINILSPGDCGELKEVLNDLVFNERGPSYIRLTGVPGSKAIYKKYYNYKFGKLKELTKGKKILAISTGSVTSEALPAINALNSEGYSIKLINLHTLRPLDRKLLKEIKSYEKIVTIEEHSIIGGLNSIISELIVKNNLKKKVISLSLSDKFSVNGKYNFLLDFHNLSERKIKKKLKSF